MPAIPRQDSRGKCARSRIFRQSNQRSSDLRLLSGSWMCERKKLSDRYYTHISKANHYTKILPLFNMLILGMQNRCSLNGLYLDIEHLLS